MFNSLLFKVPFSDTILALSNKYLSCGTYFKVLHAANNKIELRRKREKYLRIYSNLEIGKFRNKVQSKV